MKLIILDRDGVINEDSDAYIKSPQEFIPLPGSLEAIARLKKAGYTIAVATNQSGIARGYFDEAALAAMHEKLAQLLDQYGGAIDYIAYCPHGPDDQCSCRKPLPGLLNEIREHFKTDLHDVPMIGDSLRDIQAAQSVGGNPILVKTGKGERTLKTAPAELNHVPVFENLANAVDAILERTK
jgi:D-glycero-D-manno-heptose 1,7-bisphosphate phosphatase